MLDMSDYFLLNTFGAEKLLSAVKRRLTSGAERSFESLAVPLATLKARATKQFDELMLNLEAGRS